MESERLGDEADSWMPQTARDASAALMLGILGFASCGLLSPLAVYFGNRALHEIDESGGAYSYAVARNARVGQLMGIIGTSFLIIGITLGIVFVLDFRDLVSNLRN